MKVKTVSHAHMKFDSYFLLRKIWQEFHTHEACYQVLVGPNLFFLGKMWEKYHVMVQDGKKSLTRIPVPNAFIASLIKILISKVKHNLCSYNGSIIRWPSTYRNHHLCLTSPISCKNYKYLKDCWLTTHSSHTSCKSMKIKGYKSSDG